MGVLDRMANFSTSNVEPKSQVKVKKSELFLDNLIEKGYNLEELGDVIKKRGNQLIIACAGAGKTTGLIAKIQYDILTGELLTSKVINGTPVRVMDSVLVSTFLKSGAEELDRALANLQRKLGMQVTSGSLTFSTLHAEFYRAVRGLGYSFTVISDKENRAKLREVIAAQGIRRYGSYLNATAIDDLIVALEKARCTLSNKRYVAEIFEECNLNPVDVDNLLKGWRTLRRQDNRIDFQDMEEILYEECRKGNQVVIDYLSSRYSVIYLDEFQDTSEMQYELIKVYASKAKKIVAIGDDDQTIYSFRGSNLSVITSQFMKDFNVTPDTITLNYRCPSNILNVVIPSITENKVRVDKGLRSAKDGGVHKHYGYSTLEDAAHYAENVVYDALSRDKSVTILTRTNLEGLVPALSFEKSGRFGFSISSEGMTLNSYIGREILNISKIFTSSNSKNISDVIGKLCSYKERSIVKAMADYCEAHGLTVFELDFRDQLYSLPILAKTLKKWSDGISTVGEIEVLKEVLHYFAQTVYYEDNSFHRACQSVISSIIYMIETSKAKTVRQFVEELIKLNNKLKARIKTDSLVSISTVHEFKGKESDVVIVWNDSADIFPHQMTDMDNDEEIEEERRIHYIALTRAREEQHIIYNRKEPGYFFQELDLTGSEEV